MFYHLNIVNYHIDSVDKCVEGLYYNTHGKCPPIQLITINIIG